MLVCNDSEKLSTIFSSIFETEESGEILPLNQWKDNLIGRWKGETITYFHMSEQVRYLDEIFEFKSIGDYAYYFTLYEYDGPKIKSDYLFSVEGGSHSGTWNVDSLERKFQLNIKKCEMSSSSNLSEGVEFIDHCQEMFKPNTTHLYGDLENHEVIRKVKVFSKNRILIKGKVLGNAATFTCELTRLNE